MYIGIYGVSPEHFGYFFIMNITIMIAMTVFNRQYVLKWGSERMLQFGILLQLLAGIWLIITASLELGLWPMAIGVSVFVGMISLIISNSSAAILDHYPQMAGTANAVAGTARFGLASIIGIGLSYIPITSERPMLYAMASCIIVGTLCYYFLTYRQHQANQ